MDSSPPGSIDTSFTPSAARCCLYFPTLSEPVDETLRTIGERKRDSASIRELPLRGLATPAGMPASCRARTSLAQLPGASPAGQTMTEHPATRAAANLRAGNRSGEFQAANAATTPTG